MLIKVDESVALDMLTKRVEYWTEDKDVIKLFEKMYDNYIYGGCFEESEFDVQVIVDNDYVNYCAVICEGDESYKDIKKLYDEQGLGDISCEYDLNNGYSFIEAEHNGMFLVRY